MRLSTERVYVFWIHAKWDISVLTTAKLSFQKKAPHKWCKGLEHVKIVCLTSSLFSSFQVHFKFTSYSIFRSDSVLSQSKKDVFLSVHVHINCQPYYDNKPFYSGTHKAVSEATIDVYLLSIQNNVGKIHFCVRAKVGWKEGSRSSWWKLGTKLWLR